MSYRIIWIENWVENWIDLKSWNWINSWDTQRFTSPMPRVFFSASVCSTLFMFGKSCVKLHWQKKNVFLLLAHTSRSIHDSTAPHCWASSLTAGSSFPLHPGLLRLISPHSLRLTFFCRLLLISWIENVESLQCALQKVVAISGKIIRVNPCVCCARPVSLLNSAPTGGGRRRRNESDHYRLLGSRVTHRLWVIRSRKRVWPTKSKWLL